MADIAENGEAAGVAALREKIETWRRTRLKPGPMPERLWQAAARLARKHGINPTAKSLRVQYYGLKDRIEGKVPGGSRGGRPPRKPTFVEVPRLPAAPSVNVMEIARPSGTKITVRLSAAADVVAVLESVWRAEG